MSYYLKSQSSLLKSNQSNMTNLSSSQHQQLTLSYRPPLDWPHLLSFYRKRAIQGIEAVDETTYYRSFKTTRTQGWFRASLASASTLAVEYQIDDERQIAHMESQIRRLFDLDADIDTIQAHLKQTAIAPLMSEGLRIPGAWSHWEAGIRAIFGQQISITAAITLLNRFIATLNPDATETFYFPTPSEVANADLSLIKMPQSRKQTLQRFANYMIDNFDAPPDEWIALKGIGPWTISYAKLRGLSQPDCFLSSDLVIKKAITELNPEATTHDVNTLTQSLSPWGSYATFHCWNSQS